jgi:hypothetical protein
MWQTSSIRCQEGLYFKNFMQQMKTSYNWSLLFVHFIYLNLPYFIIIIIVKWCHIHLICHGNSSRWSFEGALFILFHFKVLRSTTNHFPYCLFPSIVDDTHIIRTLSIISYAYEHFQTKLYVIGLYIQPQKCIARSPSGLPLNFNTPPICHPIRKN